MHSMSPMIAVALRAFAALAAPAAAGGEPPAAITLPLTARGNEPNWVLTLETGKMRYRTADGSADINATLPEAEATGDGGWIYRAAQADLVVTIRPGICHDTMTGMPSPLSVSVETAGRNETGCGGNSSDLLGGGKWRVSSIGDETVADDVMVSMEFDLAAKSVSGSSGCNRYFGAFFLSGEGLRFEQGMAGSMMACEELPGRIEAAFLAAMADVDRFDIGPGGSLLLIAADHVVIRAGRDARN